MANENQLRLNTMFIGTRNVKEYRATIPVWVNEDDIVLEIGCEWGTTTRVLAEYCREVIATDISQECIQRAREKHPDLHFEVLDGFDVRAALALGKQFTKIYIDISGMSGYRSLLDVISLLTMYATVFRPEAIIIKSGALKHFASHCVPWRGSGENGKVGKRENEKVRKRESEKARKRESEKVRKRENGKVGKRENEKVRKRENEKVRKRESGKVGKRESEKTGK